ncbi:MAG: hypothetical protein ABI761_17810, partial [Saprospiraceae bacterium]
MKKTNKLFTIIFLSLFFLRINSIAQVMESKNVMSKGEQSSLTIEIPGVSSEYTDDVYKDFTKDFKAKTKKDKKVNEWYSDDAKVASIANGAPIDIYTKIESAGNSSKVSMWIDLGTGYVNSSTYPREYEESGKLLAKFAQAVKVSQAEDELEGVEKEYKKSDSDLKKLKKDNDDYHKEIEKC